MIEVLLFGVLASLGMVVLVAAHRADEARWRRSLTSYRLRFPSDLKPEQVSSFLAGLEPAGRGAWSATSPIVLEIVATKSGIEHRLLAPKSKAEALLAQLQAALPGVRYELLEDLEEARAGVGALAIELGLRSRDVPLGVERVEASSAAVLASLQPLRGSEVIRLQWLICGGAVPPLSARATGLQSFLDGDGVPDGDQLRARRKKHGAPLLRAVCRIGVQAGTPARARQLLGRVTTSYTVMDAPGATIRRRRVPASVASRRLSRIALPWFEWPMVINGWEGAGLVGWPVGELELPGLNLGAARQLAVPYGVLRQGVLVGRSDHPAGDGRAVRLATADRLQHLHVIGPTGTGKSTFLASLALQDIERGRGVVVIDPKRDLVEAIAARIPRSRLDDVVLLDPTDVDRPVGMNVLGGGGSEAGRELRAEFVLGVLQSLFADSWGPRTDDVLRSALLTLVSVPAPNGSAFTLCEVPELLMNPELRGYVLLSSSVPESLRGFWSWFEALSPAERATICGPALNKLRAFTARTPIRLLLGQSAGFDPLWVLTERKILLVPLSAGELGRPAAELLGALIVAQLWQAIRSRTAIPVARRHPVFLYLDEFQDVLRLPLDVADLLAQARGLGVGLTLAHQYLGQLPSAVRSGVLATARSQIVFQVGHEDARALAPGLAPLTSEELMRLEAYSAVVKASHQGQVIRPVTVVTEPLPDISEKVDVRGGSRDRFGVERREIEAGLRARAVIETSATSFGRRRAADPEAIS